MNSWEKMAQEMERMSERVRYLAREDTAAAAIADLEKRFELMERVVAALSDQIVEMPLRFAKALEDARAKP